MSEPPFAGSVTTRSFGGFLTFRPDTIARIVSVIVGGAPFSASLTRQPTARASVTFPVVTDTDDPDWVPEMGTIPLLDMDTEAYNVAAHKLAGIVLASLEAVHDEDWPIEKQVEQVMRDTFSAKLDRDLIGGDGENATPRGVLAVAPETAGADLELAAIAAQAQIGQDGGTASHIALNPLILGQIKSARDQIGRPLYPDADTTFAGLSTVTAPAAAQPLVYDAKRAFLIVRKDFTMDMSNDYGPAYERYAVALRLTGRFTVAVPTPNNSIRKLTVTSSDDSDGDD